MFTKYVYIVVVLLCCQSFSLTADELDNSLTEKTLNKGWYYFAGIGLSGSRYTNTRIEERSSMGGHLSTAVGYHSGENYGLEIGSIVSITKFDKIPASGQSEQLGDGELILWNSVFFFGARMRIPEIATTDLINPYLRIFQGWGNGVGFLSDLNEEYAYMEDYRFQLEGPVWGLSIGNMFNDNKRHTLWFVELTLIIQIYWQGYTVTSSEELPVIINKISLSENDHNIQGHLTVGTLFF